MANVFLLPVRRSAALSSIPSKLSSYMLSARPVLASVDADSDSARVVREAQCGWVIEPENREELVRHLRELSAISLESLALKGARGREYAMEHFSRSRGVERITALLKKVQDKAKPATQKPVAVDAEPA